MKNAMASERGPDEQNETQYLSQVTKRGFFASSNANSKQKLRLSSNRRQEEDFNDRDNGANFNIQEGQPQIRNDTNNQNLKSKTLHKQLQDIAYKVKHRKRPMKSSQPVEPIESPVKKNTSRNVSQLTVLKSAQDALKAGMLVKGLHHNKKLQTQILK